MSWPRDVGQVPIYYARNLTQIPEAPDTRYWDGSSAPLYPFGYGLSYTNFSLGRVKTSAKKSTNACEQKSMSDPSDPAMRCPFRGWKCLSVITGMRD